MALVATHTEVTVAFAKDLFHSFVYKYSVETIHNSFLEHN